MSETLIILRDPNIASIRKGRWGPHPRSLAARFWDSVAPMMDARGCWEWSGNRFPNGYGKLGTGPTTAVQAHRLSYWLHFGAPPADLMVCHRCDNRSCVNPSHLFLGTGSDNMRDCSRKGRLRLNPRGLKVAHERSRSNPLCKRGTHARPIKQGGGFGVCRSCANETRSKWRTARREAGLPYA